MKRLTIGLLAHVDAGKTTLSEYMLYKSGEIRKKGRVDHGDTTLDSHPIERQRGITVFSKVGHLKLNNTEVYLIDTPGHSDFCYEMERSLSALDYAILIVNGSKEIDEHTVEIFNRIREKTIPAFIFVNKMDMSYIDKEEIISDLKKKLCQNMVDFSKIEDISDVSDLQFQESVAESSEELLEKYFEGEIIEQQKIKESIHLCKIYPVVFGSALKEKNVDKFLEIVDEYTLDVHNKCGNSEFCGKIFKISRDDKGNRVTFFKINSGSIKVKEQVHISKEDNDKYGDVISSADVSCEVKNDLEKINQLRLYQGEKFELISEAYPGMVVAATGITKAVLTKKTGEETYQIILKEGMESLKTFNILSVLNDEMPDLNISYRMNDQLIDININGQVQKEIVVKVIKDRFGFDIDIGHIDLVLEETEIFDESEIDSNDVDQYDEVDVNDEFGWYGRNRSSNIMAPADVEKELKEIFERTYGKIKERKAGGNVYSVKARTREATNEEIKKYLLIDGYNVIYAWDELSELAKVNFDAARQRLMDIVSSYAGTKDYKVMIVFDAYKVRGNIGSSFNYHNITIVYTKEAETADAYIEKFAHTNSKKYDITVVTSDGVEQIIITGAGCKLISSREFKIEVEESIKYIMEMYEEIKQSGKMYLFDYLDKNFKEALEDVRLGKKDAKDL